MFENSTFESFYLNPDFKKEKNLVKIQQFCFEKLFLIVISREKLQTTENSWKYGGSDFHFDFTRK